MDGSVSKLQCPAPLDRVADIALSAHWRMMGSEFMAEVLDIGWRERLVADLLNELRARLPDVRLVWISRGHCNFDTDPSILAEMKYNGVPNEVLQAMIEAPYGPPRQETVKRPPASEINDPNVVAPVSGQVIVLPEGEEFTVQTVDEISSNTASENDPINLRVVEDVKVGNQVVIASGTLVKGIVASVEERGHLGKGGKLGLRVESTTTIDRQRVKLRASKGKGNTGTVGSTLVLSLLISPLFLLRRGNHAVIKSGTKIQVFTDEAKRVLVPEKE
jgi:hypothetical protein